MRLIRMGLASVNPTVGAIRSNVARVLELAREMAAQGAAIGCFPEQVVGGYPSEDLIQWRPFVSAQREALEGFAADSSRLGTAFVVGVVVQVGAQLFNAAAVVHAGRIVGLVPKEELPTYSVFYERRTFSRGAAGLRLDAGGVPLGDLLFRFDFGTLAVEVCEDSWSPDGPMRRRCYSGAELVVNVSSSPYRVGILGTRREMLATRSADNQAVVAYANLVGGQDALVFDGGGFVFQNGRLVLDAPRFREGIASCIVDLDRTQRLRLENTTWRSDCEAFQRASRAVPVIEIAAPTCDRSTLAYPAPPDSSFFLPSPRKPERSPREEVLDELFEALALGVKDYYVKSAVFRAIGVALSGGRDSLLTLLVAWRAVELMNPGLPPGELRARVERTLAAFYMPSRFSTEAPRKAAERICADLGVTLRVVPIDDAFERESEATRAMLAGAEPTPVTLQNVQARLRGARMWNWANTAGALFLQTSDMSEKAVGYTTIGGDLEGGLSVLANVPKTVVIALLERLHARFGFAGIALCLATTAGPELAAAQDAQQELMPFPVLDACLHLYAGEKLAPDEMVRALASLFPDVDRAKLAGLACRFVRAFTGSIYKWVQAPLALHVGTVDLDRERALQLPVIERNEWQDGRGD